jgi:hypothetical protein
MDPCPRKEGKVELLAAKEEEEEDHVGGKGISCCVQREQVSIYSKCWNCNLT